jgi:tRNA pseudouridine13 synthase
MQRFGTYSVRTHEIGKEILNQNWKEVCRLILIQHVGYIPEMKLKKEAMCKLVFDPKAEGDPNKMVDNIEEAMDYLDNRDRLEKIILLSLKCSPNGYFNAFQAISKNTRFIYIHAY